MSLSGDLGLSIRRLTIDATGHLALTGRLVLQEGSESFVNLGVLSGPTVEVHLTDSLINSGTLAVDTLLAYEGELYNDGELSATQFFGAAFYPSFPHVRNHGNLHAGNFYCARPLVNEGAMFLADAELYTYYSAGGTATADSWVVQSILELDAAASLLIQDSLQVVQFMDNAGLIQCGSFINGGMMGTAQTRLLSGGSLLCHAFTNESNGILFGPGSLCISGHSLNLGAINGPITVCDITLDNLVIPYVDDNQGVFTVPVYPCGATDCSTVGEQELPSPDRPRVFPSPTTGDLTIESERLIQSATIVIRNGLGQICVRIPVSGPGRSEVDISALHPGAYLAAVEDSEGRTMAVFTVLRARD